MKVRPLEVIIIKLIENKPCNSIKTIREVEIEPLITIGYNKDFIPDLFRIMLQRKTKGKNEESQILTFGQKGLISYEISKYYFLEILQ